MDLLNIMDILETAYNFSFSSKTKLIIGFAVIIITLYDKFLKRIVQLDRYVFVRSTKTKASAHVLRFLLISVTFILLLVFGWKPLFSLYKYSLRLESEHYLRELYSISFPIIFAFFLVSYACIKYMISIDCALILRKCKMCKTIILGLSLIVCLIYVTPYTYSLMWSEPAEVIFLFISHSFILTVLMSIWFAYIKEYLTNINKKIIAIPYFVSGIISFIMVPVTIIFTVTYVTFISVPILIVSVLVHLICIVAGSVYGEYADSNQIEVSIKTKNDKFKMITTTNSIKRVGEDRIKVKIADSVLYIKESEIIEITYSDYSSNKISNKKKIYTNTCDGEKYNFVGFKKMGWISLTKYDMDKKTYSVVIKKDDMSDYIYS